MQGKEEQVYVLIPPKPFRRGPPLNSTALLRLKSTKEKRRSYTVLSRAPKGNNRFVPKDEYLKELKAPD